MKKIGILIDSTATVDQAYIKKHNIELIFNSVNDDDGNIYVDDCTDAQKEMLCNLIVGESKAIRTSSINSQIIEDKFREMMKRYDKIIYLCLAPSFSGQYNNAVSAKANVGSDDVYVVHSNSIAVQTEVVLRWMVENLKVVDGLSQEALQDTINGMSRHITTMFTANTFEGMMITGRIPPTVAKILKLAKMFPIIRAEETNTKNNLYRKWTESIPNVLKAVDERFNQPPRGNQIQQLYLCQSLCTSERIAEIKQAMADHFNYDINAIMVRTTPLAVLATTLKNSFGICVYTVDSITKKD